MKKILIIIYTISIFGYAQLSGQENLTGMIKINSGMIKGFQDQNSGILVFKGIPYAAPPVGNLRWKAPIPVSPWNGILECTKNPASAMQAKPTPFFCWSVEFMAPVEPLSEDCLYLNVWTPAKSAKENLPVIVWIHGGAFTGGSGTVPLYDGTEISKKGCVFVTINYRLGIFGFLAYPELSQESELKTSGNYGILDQIAALKWVKENIKSFGGNPDNVTIAGQSAGAFSVNALMASPLAKGLFHRAIAHSGGMFNRGILSIQNSRDAENSGKAILDKAGIKNLAELRSKSSADLMAVQGRWAPVIDNIVIPDVMQTFSAGRQNDVPLLTGWNADDGFMPGNPLKAEAYKKDIVKKYGQKSEEFLELFPGATDEEAAKSQKLFAQLTFGWQNYTWASLQSSKGKNKAWVYYFSQVPPGEPNYGAFHSAEFGYALHTLKLWNRPFTDWDYQLEEIMSSYWVNFAGNGNPNGDGLQNWPAFDNTNHFIIEFGSNIKIVPLPMLKQLLFIDKMN
ncbi:MAG: carboxylesterase family protein [Bacteroidales bacterium]